MGPPGGAQAQGYPSRPVNVIVPFPAGGSTDWLARMLSQKLEQRLKGGSFVVENRPGGANVVAAVSVAKAPPDGHTLLMTTSTTMAINVSVFKNLAYDPAKDFIPVALVSGVPFVLVVNAALPVKSIADLVREAKAKPGGLAYASTGAGSAAHLYMVLLQNALGIPMTGVPYKGNAPGLQDTIAGHVSVMFSDLLGALPHIRAGKLRVLGVSTKDRAPAAPDLLTLQEAGVPGYDASAWQMLVAPAKTSARDRRSAQCRAQCHRARAVDHGRHQRPRPRRGRHASGRRFAEIRAVRDRALGQGGGGRRRQRYAVVQ